MTLQRTSSKRHNVQQSSRSTARQWTAVEKFRLKGLAKQALSAEKIARALGRSVGATVAMASKLGVSLDDPRFDNSDAECSSNRGEIGHLAAGLQRETAGF